MVLPILISVSVAPVSYFFWATAPPLATAIATIAIGIARLSFVENILFPLDFSTLVVDGLKIVRELPCTVPHQEDDKEQQDADVRHEDDECGTRDRARQFEIVWSRVIISISNARPISRPSLRHYRGRQQERSFPEVAQLIAASFQRETNSSQR